MDIISSPKNEKIKELVKLQTAKGRKKAGMYLLEGEHLVEEAIKEKAPIELIVVTSNRLEDYQNLLTQTDVQVLVVSQDVFHKLSMTETTQGIIAVVKIVKQDSLPYSGRFIVLDAVQDPGNLGTIVRTADAAGFDAVVLGCTHYPLLKETISSIYPNIKIVDPAKETAQDLKEILIKENLLKNDAEKGHEVEYFVTDGQDKFKEIGIMFLNENIDHVNLIKL